MWVVAECGTTPHQKEVVVSQERGSQVARSGGQMVAISKESKNVDFYVQSPIV